MHISHRERALRFALGAACLLAAAYVFTTPAARAVAVLLGGYFILVEGILGLCPIYQALGHHMKDREALSKEVVYVLGALGVQMVLAYEWLVAGWEKIISPDFAEKLPGTLTFFASKNPLPWVQSFLQEVAVPNAPLLAELVRWGEFAVGAGLLVSMIVFLFVPHQTVKRAAVVGMIAALKGGAFLSAVFYVSAGWTSPSTHGVNMVMFWAQAALAWMWSYHFLTVPSHQQLLVRRG